MDKVGGETNQYDNEQYFWDISYDYKYEWLKSLDLSPNATWVETYKEAIKQGQSGVEQWFYTYYEMECIQFAKAIKIGSVVGLVSIMVYL